MAGLSESAVNFTDKVLVKKGKHVVSAMKYINEDAAVRFCQVFDAAAIADVTLGTTRPKWILTAGANGGDDDYVGPGLLFKLGVVIAGTTTALGSTLAAANTQHLFLVIE